MYSESGSGFHAATRGCYSSILQVILALSFIVGFSCRVSVAQTESSQRFNVFVKQQAFLLRAGDVAPESKMQWERDRDSLRQRLLETWGGFPDDPCPLEPRVLGELQRDGYRVEKLLLQTMPNVWMTANAYVPTSVSAAKVPAVLCVHGHWSGAKHDPVVQSRCIGLVKLGFFVLCVDAFGAGERAVEKQLGQYHGEMTGAMLLPIGRPLSGIQVYENMRAVDYLQSRPEVDPDRIGITGASGGGNQSMYAGAFDERIQCVVPTCSVGNYQAYLSAACCMCEVVPGALRFTEEGNVLGLAAGRGLMITSATQDAFQFSVDQARISVARATAIAGLLNSNGSSSVKHTIIESPHNYNQPMREAMYGWMTLHLKGEGTGDPIAEPQIQPEEPEALRCFPGDSRPDDFVTLPRFAFAEATQILSERSKGPDKNLLAELSHATTADEITSAKAPYLKSFETALGDMPAAAPLKLQSSNSEDGKSLELTFETEPGLAIFARCDRFDQPEKNSKPLKLAVVINADIGADLVFDINRVKDFRDQGWTIVAPELRATGRFALASDKIGNAPDHNSAEWSLWLGRPLLAQWVWDIRRTLDAIETQLGSLPHEIAILGINSSGTIALTAAALDSRISHAMTFDSLTSFVSDKPYRGQRLGLLVPGLLRDVGDIGHIAALIAPRKVTIHGGVNASGEQLDFEAMQKNYSITSKTFSTLNVPDNLEINAMVTTPGAVP